MKKFFLLCIMAIVTTGLNAQWQPLPGPYGGNIMCSVTKDQMIFAGTGENGIYCSTDQGNTWSTRNNGLFVFLQISALELQQSRLFAVAGGKLFFSDNDGGTWIESPVNATLPDPVSGLGTTDDYIFITTGFSLLRSDDHGASWTTLTDNLSNFEYYGLKKFCFTDNYIYITSTAVNQRGFYRSDNNGVNFEWIDLYYAQIFIDNIISRNNELYGTGISIYRSMDYGNTWDLVSEEVPYYSRTVFLQGNRLYAAFGPDLDLYQSAPGGVYYSDNGTTWTYSGLKGVSINDFCSLNNKIFACASPGGIYKTSDAGSSWTDSGNGLPKIGIRSFDISGSKIIAASQPGPVYLSDDRGNSWKRVGMDVNASFVKLWSGVLIADNLFSADNGDTWDTLIHKDVKCIAISNDRLYAATPYDGIFISDNSGSSWSSFSTGLTSSVMNALNVIGNKVYASTEGGLFVTDGSSAGWTRLSNGLIFDRISACGGNDNVLFAADYNDWLPSTQSHVYRSEDQGELWYNSNPNAGEGHVTVFEASDDKIFMGEAYGDYPVFMSDDDGDTWSVMNNNLPIEKDITMIMFSGNDVFLSCASDLGGMDDPSPTSGIYKASLNDLIPFRPAEDTVFLNRDAGTTASVEIRSTTPWEVTNTLPPWFTIDKFSSESTAQINITSLSANPWEPDRYFTLEITSMGISRNLVVSQYGKLIGGTGENETPEISIYPNPATEMLNIKAPGFDKVTISDISGKILFTGKPASGKISIDMTNVVRGLYYVTLSGEKGILTKKIIKK